METRWGPAYKRHDDSRADESSPETIYGIVAIGHYSRFHELGSGEATLHNFNEYDGRRLHLKRDELEIDKLLCQLVELTKMWWERVQTVFNKLKTEQVSE